MTTATDRPWSGYRSGRPDSNRRPSDPQSDALTKLRHGPSNRILPLAVRAGLPGPEAQADRDTRQAELAAEPVLEVPLVRRARLVGSSEDHEGRRPRPYLRGVVEVPRRPRRRPLSLRPLHD